MPEGGGRHYRGKRTLDVVVSMFALVVLAVPAAIIALVIRLRLGRPVLFVQERPGLHGTPFNLYKFRTMTDACDQSGRLLPDVVRMTRLGRVLRRTSLDELPELLNVLRGDMSLVGPRPLLMHYLALYSPEQARRHQVRPGLTGPAQIAGRNAVSWNERFRLDVWYVENNSLWLDLRIIFKTVVLVLSGHGVNQPGEATTRYFQGESDG